MRNQPILKESSLISVLFILSIILSSCATATPVVPGEDYLLAAQTLVDVPGGLMVLPDAVGTEHPVLVFDFQIQSRLVVGAEYAACVEAGECEPAGETEYPLAPAGVNWYQAQAYCSYLGGRLPTEAELVRATGGGEDCSETGGGLITQDGFGEWVYDWDDPDFYNGSLVTNPFGPMYGDMKVAMGLDLDDASEAMGKYFVKWDELKLDELKLSEFKSGELKPEEIKLEEIKLEEIKLEEIKLDEIRFKLFKYFSDGDWQYTKEDWHYSITFENGKFFIEFVSGEHTKWDPSEGSFYPRMGFLPDQSNQLVGFRCVTEGASLSYAPICKTETAPQCSLPPEKMETISMMMTEADSVEPNFEIAGANCPQDGYFDLSISHDLPSGEGVGVKAGGEECSCQEYLDYPGKLYCNCPSPGAGVKTEIEACASDQETLISMDDYCPVGFRFDLLAGGCTRVETGIPLIYSLVDEGAGASSCPSGPGLPVPNYGPLVLGVVYGDSIGEGELPGVDQWDYYSLSDGSGMCPPGYAFNQETGCCSPYSSENYDCGPDHYFDAGLKQCLPVGWDGCSPCYNMEVGGKCAPVDEDQFISPGCNRDIERKSTDYDEYGQLSEYTEGCTPGAYKDPGLGLCLETRDGCARGYYLDPQTGTCRPISGPESPCPEGYTYNPLTGCCVPSPGTGESECPEGTEYDGAGCTALVDGCPPTHYYDEETDSCLLIDPGECPGGTSMNLIGKCIPDIPGECPDGTEYEPISGTCPSGPQPDSVVCTGNKIFDTSTGFCDTPPPGTRRRGDVVIEDLGLTIEYEKSSPKISEETCPTPRRSGPTFLYMSDTGGIYRCLLLTVDKTFQTGIAFCRPDPAEDCEGEQYFTVVIEEGRIASIVRVSPDAIDPASAEAPPDEPTECGVQYVFGEKYDPDSDDEDEDDWSGEPTSGTLPGGAKCQLNIYLDAGEILNLNNCTTMVLYVPICTVGPTPTPASPCDGLDFGTCGNTTGCGWNGSACVACSELIEKDCGLAGGCYWDNNSNQCVSN